MVDIPEHERPIGERYRVLSKQWREADKRARYYKDNKRSVFARMVEKTKQVEGDMPTNKAESKVNASDAWEKWLSEMSEAVNKAADLKEELTALKIEADDRNRQSIESAVERKYARYS